MQTEYLGRLSLSLVDATHPCDEVCLLAFQSWLSPAIALMLQKLGTRNLRPLAYSLPSISIATWCRAFRLMLASAISRPDHRSCESQCGF
jgi:hypothetical protein